MKVAVFGLGYVGFTSCCCIANDGHTVVGVDVDPLKVSLINKGQVPFEEPGLEEKLRSALNQNSISATTNPSEALEGAELVLVCVGTPSNSDGSHDMRYIIGVTREISRVLKGSPSASNLCLTYRSTIKPGTLRHKIANILTEEMGDNWRSRISLAFNPEFLREGKAIYDYYNPSRIVIGTDDEQAPSQLSTLYQAIDAPTYSVDLELSELVKFVDNTWHATKVAFANEVGRTCLSLGVDPGKLHEIFIADTKLNLSSYYTRPGAPFGGSCLPKDTRAFVHLAKSNNVDLPLIGSLALSNEVHKEVLVSHISQFCSQGDNILFHGITFKADTDDIRESPFVAILAELLILRFNVEVFDENVDLEKLTGKNYADLINAIPNISNLLVKSEEVTARDWDVLVNCHSELELPISGTVKIVNLFKL